MKTNTMGNYFEDFIEGDVIQHSLSKTIFESDNNLFSLLTMNHHPVHINLDYAEKEQHQKILVVGTLVFSVVVGITVQDISGKAIANLDYEKIEHLAPVFIGDTLYAETKVLECRESKSKKDRGIIYVETVANNQNGIAVLRFRRHVLIKKRSTRMEYSFVIPCYNSEKSIKQVVQEISNEMHEEKISSYEIILVNDSSSDNTWNVLLEINKSYDNIKVINLARNFGQHAALMAGFSHCVGEYIVTVDDDLQTPINEIKKLREKIDEGYDVSCAKYVLRERKSITRTLGTKLNRFMMKWLIGSPNGVIVSVFLMAKRYVIEEMAKYQAPYPYISGLVIRTTHNIANVEMKQNKREFGNSGYRFKKLLALWLDGFTAFSIKPLRIASFIGVVSALLGIAFGVVTVIRKLMHYNVLVGWSSLLSVNLLIGGIILLVLGMIGEYLGRIYMCINNTPQYVIKDIFTSRERDL